MSTVQNLLSKIASFLNQDPTQPTGTDQTSWINLINQSQDEWADVYQWRALRKTITPTVSNSQTSIGLPANYKRLMSPIWDYSTGLSSPTKYNEIRPNERFLKQETDKYIVVSGNVADGFYMTINPALVSGASLVFDIQVVASSLTSLTDTVVCPDDQFLVSRTLSKILAARSDPRFPTLYDESNDHMSHMIEDEATLSGGQTNTVSNAFQNNNWRVGEQ
jgi:hypothetical protein